MLKQRGEGKAFCEGRFSISFSAAGSKLLLPYVTRLVLICRKMYYSKFVIPSYLGQSMTCNVLVPIVAIVSCQAKIPLLGSQPLCVAKEPQCYQGTLHRVIVSAAR